MYEMKVDFPHAESPRKSMVTVEGSSMMSRRVVATQVQNEADRFD